MRLDIPERLYHGILATWCAVVVGAVVIFGQRMAPALRPTPTVIETSSGPMVENLEEEIRVLRLENLALLDVIAENLPEHPCLDDRNGDLRASEAWLRTICYPDTAMQQPLP